MGRYITSTSEKIKPEGLSKTRQVYPGDLVLSNSMSFGRPYIMAVEGCIHDGWLLIRDTQNQFDPVFLCHMLGTPQMLDQYRMFASGSTVNNLNKELVGNAMVPLPNRDEQVKIGKYLDQLDSLITLHQRKWQNRSLCGYLSWEQRKLGEIAPVTMGQSPNGTCYTDNPNDAVLVQGNADLKDGWVSPRVWTTEITKTAKSGDLIMSVRAPVGAMGKTAYDVVLGRGVAGIAGNEFLFQALSKKEAEGYWSTVSAGSTFDSINGDELRSTPVDCPCSETEREAIGSCLSKIDHLITLHQ